MVEIREGIKNVVFQIPSKIFLRKILIFSFWQNHQKYANEKVTSAIKTVLRPSQIFKNFFRFSKSVKNFAVQKFDGQNQGRILKSGYGKSHPNFPASNFDFMFLGE